MSHIVSQFHQTSLRPTKFPMSASPQMTLPVDNSKRPRSSADCTAFKAPSVARERARMRLRLHLHIRKHNASRGLSGARSINSLRSRRIHVVKQPSHQHSARGQGRGLPPQRATHIIRSTPKYFRRAKTTASVVPRYRNVTHNVTRCATVTLHQRDKSVTRISSSKPPVNQREAGGIHGWVFRQFLSQYSRQHSRL